MKMGGLSIGPMGKGSSGPGRNLRAEIIPGRFSVQCVQTQSRLRPWKHVAPGGCEKRKEEKFLGNHRTAIW